MENTFANDYVETPLFNYGNFSGISDNSANQHQRVKYYYTTTKFLSLLQKYKHDDGFSETLYNSLENYALCNSQCYSIPVPDFSAYSNA